MESGRKNSKGIRKWASKWGIVYIFSGVIWYLSQGFVNSTGDEITVLVIAILAGYSFYLLDKKYKSTKK